MSFVVSEWKRYNLRPDIVCVGLARLQRSLPALSFAVFARFGLTKAQNGFCHSILNTVRAASGDVTAQAVYDVSRKAVPPLTAELGDVRCFPAATLWIASSMLICKIRTIETDFTIRIPSGL